MSLITYFKDVTRTFNQQFLQDLFLEFYFYATQVQNSVQMLQSSYTWWKPALVVNQVIINIKKLIHLHAGGHVEHTGFPDAK